MTKSLQSYAAFLLMLVHLFLLTLPGEGMPDHRQMHCPLFLPYRLAGNHNRRTCVRYSFSIGRLFCPRWPDLPVHLFQCLILHQGIDVSIYCIHMRSLCMRFNSRFGIFFRLFLFSSKFDLLFPSLFTRRRDDDCQLRGFSQLRRAALTQTSVEHSAYEKRESSTATVYNTEYTLFGLDL